MGRQLRRIALDFDWPLNKPWAGFVNPYYQFCAECRLCGRTGLNPATRQLDEDWYDLDGTGREWRYAITQDEVDALVKSGRPTDLTHTWTREDGWKPKDPPHHPTADEVNAWAQTAGILGHDSCNRWICVKARAKRLGVYGECDACKGSGDRWYSLEAKRRAARWKTIEPPPGPGYQMWETVSEGSPITPVFETPEALATHLANGGGWRTDQGTTFEQWMRFIQGPGWAPSLVSSGGRVMSGVEAVSGDGGR